jgi:ABC-type branched-subunit amino acid transport system substrate-binding protein
MLALLTALFGCQAVRGPGRASDAERDAYREALAQRSQDPEAAAGSLRAFLARWPDSALADDALYELAALQLASGDETAAQATFQAVIRRYPKGNRADATRYRLARLDLDNGEPETGYRMASGIRLSRLPDNERRLAQRLLVDLSAASGDPVTQLRWLAQMHGEAPDENSRALVETEIDELVMRMDRSELRRAAEQAGKRVPAARLRLRLAELAIAQNEPRLAIAEVERVRKLPLTPSDERQLYALEVRLGLREGEPAYQLPPSLAELGPMRALDLGGVSGTLGVALPLSGPYSHFGEEALQGILLAAGIFGGKGSSGVHVRVRDTRGTSEGAAEAVRLLAEDPEVGAVVGPLAVREAVGAAQSAREGKLPLLALSRPDRSGATNPWTFRIGLARESEARLLADFAMRELGAQRFAILYPKDRYGQELKGLFWDAIEERGGVLVGVAGYDPEATDFSDSIRRLVGYVLLSEREKESIRERDRLRDRAKRLPADQARELRDQAAELTGPTGEPLPPIVDFDALFVPDSHDNVVLIAPQLAFHEVTGVQLLGTDGWNDPSLVQIGQRHVEGAVFSAVYHRELPHAFSYEFARGYEEAFEAAPAAFAALGFDATSLVLSRWAEGATSRRDLAEALVDLENQAALTGVLSIRPDGSVVRRPHLLSVQKSQIVAVD